MKRDNVRTKTVLALAVAGMLAIGPAMADKPSSHGGGKRGDRNEHSDQRNKHKAERNDHRDERNDHRAERNGHRSERTHAQGNSPGARDRSESAARERFEDRHRVLVNDYYTEQFRSGRCPPGLAKKNNGCLPPGQAKKWQVGQPLQRNVTYYSVPQPLITQLGPAPAGYRYVRVGNDVLLMSTTNRTILDAILNLGRS